LNSVLTIWDPILTPIYIFVIYLICYRIKATQIIKHPEYKYFIKGITAKIFGGIAFAMVYVYYYDGGDTNTYFLDSKVVTNMLFYKPKVAFSILADNLTAENYAQFDGNTFWPHLYIWDDNNTFSVVRYTVPFSIIGAQTYLTTTILVSCFSYIGVWKLYQLFSKLYPHYKRILAYAILLMPSFIFWGSGIMKDTYIIGATCWITYNFYQLMINRKHIVKNILLFIINFIIILNIKPYIIGCLIPAMILWVNQTYLIKIKSALFRFVILPFTVLIFASGGFYLFKNVSQSMGDYGNIDTAIERARVTQQDLLREEQYGSNNYNLGEIDGSFTGMLKIAPIAIFTAIYRPFITESNNILMLASGIENFCLLIFTIIAFTRVGIRKTFLVIKKNPLIQYSLIFSIILAFGVGIATANFGALVRYKIPLIPFYFSGLFLIYSITRIERKIKKSSKFTT